MIALIGFTGSLLLAFANGANDISKSIATLVGSGESGYKKAVVLASLAVAAGSVMASAWAVKMSLLFSQEFLAPQVAVNQIFALAILAGAMGWILLATRLGLPVSTTHAIVGSLALTGLYAFGFDNILWGNVTQKVAGPLLVSPVVAFALTRLMFRALFWLCRQQYCLNCHWAHWGSAISSGFARGLNDTPKIAALGLIFYYGLDPNMSIAPKWFFLCLALANALGGIIMGLRVTETMAHKITTMDHLEGFAANLATSLLVVVTAIKGFPVSTTHVSNSSIMALGLHKGTRALDWKIVGHILTSWIITLPAAGMIGAAAYWLLRKVP